MFSCRFSRAFGGLRPSTVARHLKTNEPKLHHQNVKLKPFFSKPRITLHCHKLHVSTWHMHSRDCDCLWVVEWLNGKSLLILTLFQMFRSGTWKDLPHAPQMHLHLQWELTIAPDSSWLTVWIQQFGLINVDLFPLGAYSTSAVGRSILAFHILIFTTEWPTVWKAVSTSE